MYVLTLVANWTDYLLSFLKYFSRSDSLLSPLLQNYLIYNVFNKNHETLNSLLISLSLFLTIFRLMCVASNCIEDILLFFTKRKVGFQRRPPMLHLRYAVVQLEYYILYDQTMNSLEVAHPLAVVTITPSYNMSMRFYMIRQCIALKYQVPLLL